VRVSVDPFLLRRYDARNYHCLHHAAEFWQALTGEDILQRLEGVLNGLTRSHVAGFTRLPAPADPCLVLMRARLGTEMHVGVYYRRRILHIMPDRVEFQPAPVVTARFRDIRYYR
jgi:hypothetical protein